MSALFLALMVIIRNVVGDLLVKASEILTEIYPKLNIRFASAIGAGAKIGHAYL
jgi:hypothetical protein